MVFNGVCNLVVRLKYVTHEPSYWELLYNVVVMVLRLYVKELRRGKRYITFYVNAQFLDGQHRVYFFETYDGVVVFAYAKNEDEAIEKIKRFIDYLKKKLG